MIDIEAVQSDMTGRSLGHTVVRVGHPCQGWMGFKSSVSWEVLARHVSVKFILIGPQDDLKPIQPWSVPMELLYWQEPTHVSKREMVGSLEGVTSDQWPDAQDLPPNTSVTQTTAG